MTQETDTRTRPFPVGCAFSAVITVGLAVIAICVVAAIAIPAFFDKPETPPTEQLGKKAGLTQYRLAEALQDGTLTNTEIAHAATAPWTAERHHSGITVTVGYAPGPTCFRYDIPLPATASEPTIHRTRLTTCPALPNKPEPGSTT
ncbi:hypothetical protein ACSCBZ_41490 [Streptomyces niveiscabiei]|uniref:hypothetical protein n=1 Tax=Streptomyces niveiscabiei TaxID=164115 RepID=UPI0006EBC009|nr:hypothetical protein [Streptomyces niveiscabiei]